jgi:cytosine/adenosine deaminase-related metal-dependent hydrolase
VDLGAGHGPPAPVVDLGEAAILPGLVNAHVHLELSWMRGRVPRAPALPAWIRSLMALRRTVPSDPVEPIEAAVAEARASGTALVGDVTNTLSSIDVLERATLSARVFRELIGFRVDDPEALVAEAQAAIDRRPPSTGVRVSLAAHAPYSVSPGVLRALARTRRARPEPTTIHLAESADEIEFVATGGGPMRRLLDEVGAWDPAWRAPGCGPVEYLERTGVLDARTLVVHGVHLTDGELARLAALGVTLVTCPRSNEATGAGTPPVARFYASGIRVAFGTDSLACVPNLDLFAELAAARRLAPEVPASGLLASATRHGAEALGFGGEFGVVVPGARAELLAVAIPAGVEDVEEYLVSGAPSGRVRWLM